MAAKLEVAFFSVMLLPLFILNLSFAYHFVQQKISVGGEEKKMQENFK